MHTPTGCTKRILKAGHKHTTPGGRRGCCLAGMRTEEKKRAGRASSSSFRRIVMVGSRCAVLRFFFVSAHALILCRCLLSRRLPSPLPTSLCLSMTVVRVKSTTMPHTCAHFCGVIVYVRPCLSVVWQVPFTLLLSNFVFIVSGPLFYPTFRFLFIADSLSAAFLVRARLPPFLLFLGAPVCVWVCRIAGGESRITGHLSLSNAYKKKTRSEWRVENGATDSDSCARTTSVLVFLLFPFCLCSADQLHSRRVRKGRMCVSSCGVDVGCFAFEKR